MKIFEYSKALLQYLLFQSHLVKSIGLHLKLSVSFILERTMPYFERLLQKDASISGFCLTEEMSHIQWWIVQIILFLKREICIRYAFCWIIVLP